MEKSRVKVPIAAIQGLRSLSVEDITSWYLNSPLGAKIRQILGANSSGQAVSLSQRADSNASIAARAASMVFWQVGNPVKGCTNMIRYDKIRGYKLYLWFSHKHELGARNGRVVAWKTVLNVFLSPKDYMQYESMSQAFLQCSQAAGSEKSVVSEKSTTIVRSLVPVTQWKTKSCCMWNYGKPCESTFPTFCSKSRFHHSRILEGHQEPVLVWSWMLHSVTPWSSINVYRQGTTTTSTLTTLDSANSVVPFVKFTWSKSTKDIIMNHCISLLAEPCRIWFSLSVCHWFALTRKLDLIWLPRHLLWTYRSPVGRERRVEP